MNPLMDVLPNLEGRQAQCVCGKLKPSSELKGDFFFQYRGEGSRAAEVCKCGFYKEGCKCVEFIPRGAMEFDSFYCGCRGWD